MYGMLGFLGMVIGFFVGDLIFGEGFLMDIVVVWMFVVVGIVVSFLFVCFLFVIVGKVYK